MLKITNTTISGMCFQVHPMPVLKAARLDKRVLSSLAPILGGLQGMDLDSNIEDVDMGAISRGIALGLQSLTEGEFTSLIKECLETVVYLPAGGAPVELNNEEALGEVFGGQLDVLYNLTVEVMRINRFTPFAMWARFGKQIKTIAGSVKAAGKTGKGGLKLARSAPLTQN